MCDFSKGFKLCACDNEKIRFRQQEFYRKVGAEMVKIEAKKNKDIPLIYIWKLFRFEGLKDDFEIGRYLLPTDDIGHGLDQEWIALNLNNENCFDFDYIPEEGDNLFIMENVVMSPYISFVFKNKQWIIDHYSPFDVAVKDIQTGKIKNVTS